MVLWLAPDDFDQLFRYLWAVSQREGVDVPWILAEKKVERRELIRLWLSSELIGAWCKVNSILCSPRLSIGGAGPLIDDQTPLSCLSKQPTQNTQGGLSCVRGVDRCKKLSSKNKKHRVGVTLCCSVQWGPHRVKTECSGWTTELLPVDGVVIFIPGKAPFTLNNGSAFSFRCIWVQK